MKCGRCKGKCDSLQLMKKVRVAPSSTRGPIAKQYIFPFCLTSISLV